MQSQPSNQQNKIEETSNSSTQQKTGFWEQILTRRIPQFFGIYLAGSWTCLEFTQWAVGRYALSPHWEEMLVVLLLLCLPLVLVQAWHHGAPGKQDWSLFEKAFAVLTLIGAPATLHHLYADKDLGSIVETVEMRGADGVMQQHTIARREYIKPLLIFPLKTQSSVEEIQLLAAVSSEVLGRDLSQNHFITSNNAFDISEDIKRSRLSFDNLPLSLQIALSKDRAKDYFINGTLNKHNEQFEIDANIYKVSNGKKIFSSKLSGGDYFSLMDTLSEQISVELTPNIPEFVDLPIGDLYTANWQAFINYSKGLVFQNFVEPQKDAIPFYQKALELDPTFSFAAFNFALFTLSRGQIINAQQYTQQAILAQQYRLTERERFALIATNYFINKNSDESFKTIDHWIALYPNDWLPYLMKAQYSLAFQNIEQSIANLRKVIEIDPSQHQLWDQIGDLYTRLGQYEEALSAYNHYIDKNPNKPLAYKNLGDLYRKNSRLDTAISNYQKALSIEPNNVNVLRNLALVYSRSGDFKQAEKIYQQALQQSKTTQDSVQVQRSLADFYWRYGKLKDSVENFQIANEKTKNQLSDTQGALFDSLDAWRYFKAGYPRIAQQAVDNALELATEKKEEILFINAQAAQALLYNQQGKAALGLPLFDNIFKTARDFLQSGNDIQINYLKSQSHFFMGDFELALPAFEAINDRFPDNLDFMFWTARTYFAIGELDKSLNLYNKILALAPGHPEYQLGLSKVLLVKEDQKGAKIALTKAVNAWQHADMQFAELTEAQKLLKQL